MIILVPVEKIKEVFTYFVIRFTSLRPYNNCKVPGVISTDSPELFKDYLSIWLVGCSTLKFEENHSMHREQFMPSDKRGCAPIGKRFKIFPI